MKLRERWFQLQVRIGCANNSNWWQGIPKFSRNETCWVASVRKKCTFKLPPDQLENNYEGSFVEGQEDTQSQQVQTQNSQTQEAQQLQPTHSQLQQAHEAITQPGHQPMQSQGHQELPQHNQQPTAQVSSNDGAVMEEIVEENPVQEAPAVQS